MSKVSVKYYLNKNLKGEADRWPVYIMIIHKRNPQRIVSRLFKGQCYTEKEFASDETAQHIVKKGTEIIENTYNYICKIYGQEFDIKNYKNTGISTITGVITEPFKERFLGVDWKTDWKFENISNFFDFINKQLNINIINCIYNNETINSFFDTNRAEFEKLGIVKNEYTKQFEGVRLGEYKYNITSDKDKEIIKKAKEKNAESLWLKHVSNLLYSENWHNFLFDEKLAKKMCRCGVDIDFLADTLLDDLRNALNVGEILNGNEPKQ